MGADHIERLTTRLVGAEVSAVVDADAARAKKAVEAIDGGASPDVGKPWIEKTVNARPDWTPWFLHQRHVASGSGAGYTILCEKTIIGLRRVLWEI